VVLVNNMNSTLGQEKSDVAIPILCGPEIAVPATKSYMNQIALFYYLALKIAEMKLSQLKESGQSGDDVHKLEADLEMRRKNLNDIPLLLKETIETTEDTIESMAAKIYMEPSLHILATKISGVAMEGALKIRETVLNHAEGREASEFKHGPNTILGKNTVFGMKNIRKMVRFFGNMIDEIDEKANERGISRHETKEIIKTFGNYMFSRNQPFNLSAPATQLFQELVRDYDFYE